MVKFDNATGFATWEYDSIVNFYNESDVLEDHGNGSKFREYGEKEEIGFRGMSIADLKKYKYSYPDAEKIAGFNEDLELGGSGAKYKYDELDGDDMNFERLIDGFPALRKRIKTKGLRNGRIITLYINIAENCNVSATDMRTKADTAVKLTDMLEERGYRVNIIILTYIEYNSSYYKGQTMKKSLIKIEAKKPEEALNKGLIYTAISPWIFRYHFFKHYVAKSQPQESLGRSLPIRPTKLITESLSSILIDSQECLSKQTSEFKLNEIKKLISSVE